MMHGPINIRPTEAVYLNKESHSTIFVVLTEVLLKIQVFLEYDAVSLGERTCIYSDYFIRVLQKSR